MESCGYLRVIRVFCEGVETRFVSLSHLLSGVLTEASAEEHVFTVQLCRGGTDVPERHLPVILHPYFSFLHTSLK